MRRPVHGNLRPILASVLLIGGLLALAPGGALAGGKTTTRYLYMGTGTANPANCSPFCPLNLSGVSSSPTGGHSFADVVVANLGPNTLNKITVVGGTAAEQAPKNDNFASPSGPSVPSPLSIAQVVPTPTNSGPLSWNSGNPCPVAADGSTFTCNVGTLLIGQSVKFRLIISVPSSASSANVWLMASLNERSSNGKNQDSFFAAGSIGVAPASCLVNQNYFLSTEAISLSTPAGCTQPTTITGAATSQGSFASVGITTPPANWCPPAAPTPCQGDLSVANVDNGQTGPVIWTITFNFVPTYVIHFHSDYDPVTNPSAYDLILLNGPAECASPSATNCWISNTPVYTGVIQTGAIVVFRTPTNTSSRGG